MRQHVGLGFDLHRLEPGRRCVLGGVELDHPTGPAGHSDGDAVLHAIADALLGAAGLDDLGTLYSDGDARWKDADSATLLAEVVSRAREAGWRPVNVDVVVATEGPRIAPHRAAMRARIAARCGAMRGPSVATTTSTLTGRQPASRARETTSASSVALSASFQRASPSE